MIWSVRNFYATETTVSNAADYSADASEDAMIAAEQAVQAAAEQAEDSATTASMLSEQDCQRLIETAKTAKVGDLTYCAYAYELEAFSPSRAEQAQSVLDEHFASPQEKLAKVFEPYSFGTIGRCRRFCSFVAKTSG